ncbi:hypothetical protein ABFS82_05G040100 [Erythranthe guttata]
MCFKVEKRTNLRYIATKGLLICRVFCMEIKYLFPAAGDRIIATFFYLILQAFVDFICSMQVFRVQHKFHKASHRWIISCRRRTCLKARARSHSKGIDFTINCVIYSEEFE